MCAYCEIVLLVCTGQFKGGLLGSTDYYPIFTNSEIELGEIEVYGFDYDFTLAQYQTKAVSRLIYDLAKRRLVKSKNVSVHIQQNSFLHKRHRECNYNRCSLKINICIVVELNKHEDVQV